MKGKLIILEFMRLPTERYRFHCRRKWVGFSVFHENFAEGIDSSIGAAYLVQHESDDVGVAHGGAS